MTDSMKFGPEWYVTCMSCGKTLEYYVHLHLLITFMIMIYLLYLLHVGCARLRQETVAILVVVAEGPQL